MGDLSSIPGLGSPPRERKGYLLQYSVLENSMDCIVHRVAKSLTWLSDLHFTSWAKHWQARCLDERVKNIWISTLKTFQYTERQDKEHRKVNIYGSVSAPYFSVSLWNIQFYLSPSMSCIYLCKHSFFPLLWRKGWCVGVFTFPSETCRDQAHTHPSVVSPAHHGNLAWSSQSTLLGVHYSIYFSIWCFFYY